ncbi:unnamed protein product [Dibothriocephalus latus]|uniref:Uncharacterized protein n=1 Tax=Dibothriocephalus latus TaxID=60516 RepID=A0A3P7P842_DIBLA|nr:unnamed protein product [Dibothriocephalus latus]
MGCGPKNHDWSSSQLTRASEDFGLVKFENMAESRRVSNNQEASFFPHQRHCMPSQSRPEQSPDFSDVFALSKTAPDPVKHYSRFPSWHKVFRPNDPAPDGWFRPVDNPN